MENLNTESKQIDDIIFDWQSIVSEISTSYNLSDKEQESLFHSPIAKLLAVMPFFTNCKNPFQLAVLKVGMYIAGLRNPSVFNHQDNQSVRERLLPGMHCPGGDQHIIELFTDFFEIISINDHLRDLQSDLQNNHPNPLKDALIFYKKRRSVLIDKIHSFPDFQLIKKMKSIADPIKLYWWSI